MGHQFITLGHDAYIHEYIDMNTAISYSLCHVNFLSGFLSKTCSLEYSMSVCDGLASDPGCVFVIWSGFTETSTMMKQLPKMNERIEPQCVMSHRSCKCGCKQPIFICFCLHDIGK